MKKIISIESPRILSVPTLTKLLLVSGALLFSVASLAQQGQTAAPPQLGQETKGIPAVAEDGQSDSASKQAKATNKSQQAGEKAQRSGLDNLLGKAEIKESRRESGQLYRVELKHSAGSTQFIEETDSDGKIESTNNDIEETPNLPKWKLGSW